MDVNIKTKQLYSSLLYYNALFVNLYAEYMSIWSYDNIAEENQPKSHKWYLYKFIINSNRTKSLLKL